MDLSKLQRDAALKVPRRTREGLSADRLAAARAFGAKLRQRRPLTTDAAHRDAIWARVSTKVRRTG